MGHRLDAFPCATTAETSNTTYQQYVIFSLNNTETLKDLKTIIHQAERSRVKGKTTNITKTYCRAFVTDFLFLKTGLLLPATLSPDSAPHNNKEQFPSFNVRPMRQCQTEGDRLGEGGGNRNT